MDAGIRRASGSFYRIGADRSMLRLFDGITGAEFHRLFA